MIKDNWVSRIIAEYHWDKHMFPVIFCLLALVLGVITIFVTPPLQGPDEDIHFLTCWKISHGDFSLNVPSSFASFSNMHGYLVAHPEQKYSLEHWKQSRQYREIPNEKQLIYTDMLYHATLSYIPALIGTTFSAIFSDRYLTALYWGRLTCLLTYIILGALALYYLPAGKPVIFLLLLTPQSIFQAAVISYDGITNGMFCLWASLLFRDIFAANLQEKRFSNALIICSIFLSICKVPYMIVSGALLLLLFMKNISGKKNILLPTVICVCVLTAALALNTWLSNFPPQHGEPFVRIMAPGQGTVDALSPSTIPLSERILQVPGLIFSTITSMQRLMIYAGSFVGCIGALDTLLPPSLLVFYLACILLLLCSSENNLTWEGKVFFLITGIGLTGMIFLIFAYAYNPVNGTIPGITGRYFIPMAFLLALALQNKCLKISFIKKYENLLAISAATILGITMIVTLLQRYYFSYWWDRTM